MSSRAPPGAERVTRPGSGASMSNGGSCAAPASPSTPGYRSPSSTAPPPTPSLSRLARPSVRLVVWGRSDMGQLGRQPSPSSTAGAITGDGLPLPTAVEALADRDVVGCCAGPFHSAFVTADGELFTCGCNDNGQLGRRIIGSAGGASGGATCVRPSHVTALESYRVAAAGCGASHTLVLTEQGSVLSWGGNEYGQTGCGSEGPDLHHPRHLKGLADQRIVRLAVGANHALLLGGSGAVFAVGQGSYGALGLGLPENRATPVPVLPLMPLGVVQVAAGENHSAALTADGCVFTWGRGRHGQLGHGDWENRFRPQQVAALRGLRAKQVACGGDHTLVLTETAHHFAPAAADSSSSSDVHPRGGGRVYSFGRGTWGATGLGSTDNTCRPCLLHSLEGEDIVQVSAGARHSLVLAASHAVFAFGNNEFGQLGLGHPGSRPPSSASRVASPGPAGGTSAPYIASPRRLLTLPPLPVLAVMAAGDCSMALLQTARQGERGPAGPRPSRRYGLYLAPYDIPTLHHLAAAAATATSDPRVLREVVAAVEDVLSSPGYVLAAFADQTEQEAVSTTATHGGGGAAGPASSLGWDKGDGSGAAGLADGKLPTRGSSPTLGALVEASAAAVGSTSSSAAEPSPPHRMDVHGIQSCFEALLRLYRPEVVSAMGNSLLKLLDAVHLQTASAGGALTGRPLSAGDRPPLGAATGTGRAGGSPLVGRSGRTAGAGAGGGGGGGGGLAAVGEAGSDGGQDGPRLALLRLLLVVFQCPLLAGSSLGLGVGNSLVSRLINVTVRMPAGLQQVLYDWLVSLPPEVLGGRVVRPLQHYVGHMAEAGGGMGGPDPGADRLEVLAGARVLAGLHAANERAGERIPYTEFHNPPLSNSVNLRLQYRLWLQVAHGPHELPLSSPTPSALGHTLVSLCQVPCLLTPEAKSRILQGEAQLQKEAEVTQGAREALMQGIHPAANVFLDVAVRRSSLLADTAQQLGGRPAHHLKRPLRVSFVSQGVPEEGVDQGGVSREFFQLLVSEIFQPQYGMFVYDEESRTFWFSGATCCLDDSGVAEFRLVGALLGLAIYNGVILDVHFPQAVYKKLLGEEVGLADLTEAFPTLGRSLQAVLTMDPDQVEEALCRTFEVQYDFFGEQRTVPLIPGGSSVPVAGANRELYVRRLVDWTLNESVDTQFRAFSHGFHQVCGGPALSLFRHEELELLVCGLPHLDFGALEAHARYDGGYTATHPTIVMFWQVLASLELAQKRRFLAFTTGCDRAPVAGLGALVLRIQKSGPDSDRLPTAHTCFNTLLLPEYSSRAKLKTKLVAAIDNSQGFGLK